MANFASLNTIMDKFMARSDLGDDQVEIALLVASRLNTDLQPTVQATEVDLTNTLGETFITLPTDFILPRSVTSLQPDSYELIQVSNRQLFLLQQQADSGPPSYFTTVGNQLVFYPAIATTDQITIKLVYLAAMATPTVGTDTNYALSDIPHIWHHCAMMYAAEYAQDMAHHRHHEEQYDRSIQAFKRREALRGFGGAPVRTRPDRSRVV